MSSWNSNGYDPGYTRYMSEQYYQEPSRFDPQSSPTYSEVQYATLDQSHYGYEHNQPYVQGQMISGDFDSSPSRSSTNVYGNRYTASEQHLAGTPYYYSAAGQERSQQEGDRHMGTKSRPKFQQIAKKPSESSIQIPSDRPTGYVTGMTSHSQSSGSMKEIGVVCYNDETQEYRYKCDREGCTRKSMGRVQDLKRHFDDFHGGLVLACPVAGCKHTRVRRDKLRKHCREAHGNEYGI